MPEYQTIVLRDNLDAALLKSERRLLEQEILPSYLAKRRWFAGKNDAIRSTRLCYLVRLPSSEHDIYLAEIEAQTESSTTRWQVPLTIVWEGGPAAALPNQLALAHVRRERRVGLLTDAFAVPAFPRQIVPLLASGVRLNSSEGEIQFLPMQGMADRLQIAPEDQINWISAEQSNSSLTIDDNLILKYFPAHHQRSDPPDGACRLRRHRHQELIPRGKRRRTAPGQRGGGHAHVVGEGSSAHAPAAIPAAP